MNMFSLNAYMFLFIFCVANAAVWMGPLPDKPKEFANQEGCYIKEENRVIPFGETTTSIGYCYSIYCERNFVHYASCGVVSTDDPHCYTTEVDLSRRHPDCCPTILCDDNNLLI